MLDFTPVKQKEITMNQFAADFTQEELRRLTSESIDRFVELLAESVNADVIFIPDDASAYDVYAEDPADTNLAWTLGHNIVHTTASGEEYAFTAAELARGVPFHGRSRSELPWETITTVKQCLDRLEESRRIRLASLELWPDQPDLTKGYVPWEGTDWVNAKGIFVWGLAHDADHQQQISKILAQSRATFMLS